MILAGGLGTRMKSMRPKVLHDILGHPMVWYVVHALGNIDENPVIVTPPENEPFREIFGDALVYVPQPGQLGSGHAVRCGMAAVTAEYVLVCNGDDPIPSSPDYEEFVTEALQNRADAALLGASVEEPAQLGRIRRGPDGSFLGVVEARDAQLAEQDIHEINTGIYLFRSSMLRKWLENLRPENAQGEYYLTDCLTMAVQEGKRVYCHEADNPWTLAGVNDRRELAQATRILQDRKLQSLYSGGVTVNMPQTVRVDWDVNVGNDTEIFQGTWLRGDTVIGSGGVIGPNATIVNARIGNRCTVIASHVEESTIGDDCVVGPFSYIRPGTVTAVHCKIGAFCEVKASAIGERSKIPHLSYVGDAQIAEDVNIGAGTITCNYDGFTHTKHRTVIERGVFIGANNNLVAPVTVHEGAYTATGSTITHDVPSESLGIARAPQVDKEGWVRRKKHGQ